MITIRYDDREIQAAAERILKAGGNLKPAMQDIGELLLVSTKKRFAEGKGPDGTPWAPNTETTLLEYLRRKGGDTVRRKGEKSSNPYFGKDGRLNKRGAGQIIAKKVLIGESKRLGNEIHYRATASSVEVGSSLEYSATQQFGAKKGDFGRTKSGRPIPWGDIPARPFLGLSEEDKARVLDILREHLEGVLSAG